MWTLLLTSFLPLLVESQRVDVSNAAMLESVLSNTHALPLEGTNDTVPVVTETLMTRLSPYVLYYIIAEWFEMAYYKHPEDVLLPANSLGCVTKWSKVFQENINKSCSQAGHGAYWTTTSGSYEQPSLCEMAAARPPLCFSKETYTQLSSFQCAKLVRGQLAAVDAARFPDGRRVYAVGWNCPVNSLCDGNGCAELIRVKEYNYWSYTWIVFALLGVLFSLCAVHKRMQAQKNCRFARRFGGKVCGAPAPTTTVVSMKAPCDAPPVAPSQVVPHMPPMPPPPSYSAYDPCQKGASYPMAAANPQKTRPFTPVA